MTRRDIVVIGASAGGVEALVRLVGALPVELPAAVFVVLHVPATGTSLLPEILARAGTLPVAHARDGEPVAPGRVYVAPPDVHMLLGDGRVHLRRGPKENSARPAADPLMRTAAAEYGPRVIGVVLTGNLDDGTAGLLAVRAAGGATVVQDPAEALFPGMPRSAVEHVAVDHVLRLGEIAPRLVQLITAPDAASAPMTTDPMPPRHAAAGRSHRGDNGHTAGRDHVHDEYSDLATGEGPSVYTCPECHGTLWEVNDDEMVRFRCRVGHRYSSETLVSEQEVALEAALWTALRALEEGAALSRRLAKRAEERGQLLGAARFLEQSADRERRAAVVRQALESGGTPARVAAAGDEAGSSATAAP